MENLAYQTYECEQCGVSEHEDIGSWNQTPYKFFCSVLCHELWDKSFNQPRAGLATLGARLPLVDDNYFDSEFFKCCRTHRDTWSFNEVSRILATYCYDCDAQFDDKTLNSLNRIAHAFGEEMRQKVMLNLFTRNHDT